MNRRSILGGIKPDTKIYRIFPQERFFELFEERKNALLRPDRWEDPYENVFLKSEVKLLGGEEAKFDFHNDVYGQCWTLERSSNAMWKIYSKGEDAIRVRTTVGRLIESLCGVHGETAHASCFIGRVNYQKVKELKEFGKNMFVWHSGAEAIAQSLLIKREAYKYESEVRLLYIAPHHTDDSKWIYKYNLDPVAIFDQAMVDGRVTREKFVDIKNEIASRTGLSRRRIHRSVLYDKPKGFVVHVH